MTKITTGGPTKSNYFMLSNAYFLNNNLILKLAIPNLDMVKEATTKEDTTKAGEINLQIRAGETNQLTKVGEINLRIKAGETKEDTLIRAGETNHLTKEATTKEDTLTKVGEINLQIRAGETNHLTNHLTKEDILARAGEINLRIKVGARTINLGVRQVLGVGEVEV